MLKVLVAYPLVCGNILDCRLRASSVWKSKDHKIVGSRPELQALRPVWLARP